MRISDWSSDVCSSDLIYIRGQREDYDGWAASGCDGWGYDDVLPVFRRAENNQRLAGPYHGNDGLLRVSDPLYRHPLSDAFVRAAQQAGVPFRSEEQTSELQSLMRISYAVFCLKKKTQ